MTTRPQQDMAFIIACRMNKFEQAKTLAEYGCNVQATEANGKAGLHWLTGEIARTWPEHKDCLETILQKGGDLNQQWEQGTVMHAIARLGKNHDTEQRRESFQAFLREAVDYYGADIAAEKPAGKERPAALGFLAGVEELGPVLRTLFALLNEHDLMDGEHGNQLATKWMQEASANWKPADCAAWWAAGVQIDAVEGGFSQVSLKEMKAQFSQWQERNHAVDVNTIGGLSELFVAEPAQPDAPQLAGRFDSPLFNPQNWQQMDALIDACSARGDVLTKEAVLAPIAEGKNFIQLAAEVACRPRQAIELCNSHGIQLGAKELLDEQGKPNDTLQSLIDVKAGSLLFRPQNWQGKQSSELKHVYNALPDLDRETVHGMQQLQIAMRADEAIGRGR